MNRLQRHFQMMASNIYRKLFFPVKRRGIEKATDSIILPGAYLYGDTVLEGRNYIGKNTELNHVKIGYGSYINNSGMLTNTVIGKYTSIGTGLQSVIGRHPLSECISTHPAFYSADAQMGFSYVSDNLYEETVWLDKDAAVQIRIGNDVWIGNDVRIMEGVSIGDGAVIATGAVVTKDVAPYSIVAGVPAKEIKKRFSDEDISKLLDLKWWDKDEAWIRENAAKFSKPEEFFAGL